MKASLKTVLAEVTQVADFFVDSESQRFYLQLPEHHGPTGLSLNPQDAMHWTWNGDPESPTINEEIFTPRARGWWLKDGDLSQIT